MSVSRRQVVAFFGASMAGLQQALAQTAASWPNKPVRLVVPSSAGSAPDIIARVMGERLSRIWGQPVVVENKFGAGGLIALTAVKNSPKENHTFVFAAASVFTLLPYMFRSSQVDFARDFVPVAMVGVSPMILAVNAASPFNSLNDLIASAKEKSEELVVATTSLYTFPHLTAYLLSRASGLKLRAIPFNNSGASVSAVVNNDAQLVIDGVPALDGMIKGGRLKPLAIFHDRRVTDRPALPAVAEKYPQLVVNGFFGMAAISGTDPQVISKVNKDVNFVSGLPEVVARLESLGVYRREMSVSQFGSYWKTERERYAKVLKELGVQQKFE
jgi:tripartite-type tricarboxylate transporter receptor subunit TctC